jgi:polysaccharide export outer membrane protein
VAYFKDIPDTIRTPITLPHTEYTEATISPDDILNITIQTIDPRSVEMISGSSATNGLPTSSATMSSASTPNGLSGYLVDKNGYIEMPLVGRVKVGGLTITQARDLLHEKANQYYKDPVVNIRFENFTISMIGEFNHPGRYVVTSERINILDAIALAGDLTITGKRENILLLREEGGRQYEAERFDLNSTEVFNSPNFYLRKGDILYTVPNKAKARTATVDFTTDRYITYGVSIATLLILISSRL